MIVRDIQTYFSPKSPARCQGIIHQLLFGGNSMVSSQVFS